MDTFSDFKEKKKLGVRKLPLVRDGNSKWRSLLRDLCLAIKSTDVG